MADVKESLREEVASAFKDLSITARSLNTTTDALSGIVGELEDALKSLGLGVSSWVEFDMGVHGITYCHDDVGYEKVGKNWCIAIRSVEEQDGEDTCKSEIWPFHEAPRHLRIGAVDRLPALLKKLDSDAKDLTKHIAEKFEKVADINFGINTVLDKQGTPLAGAKKR